MLILLFFAFLSGLVTILAPCIWPLLPIVLSATTTGERRKPLGITLGIMLSFGIFTLSISYLVSIFHFDPDILRLFAVIIIGFLGLTLVIPALTGLLERFVSRLTSLFGSSVTGNQTHGFYGGFITGLALGIVWAPCAGPILATIATLAATRTVNFEIVLVTIVYIIGVGIPLLLFATAGSAIFAKSKVLNNYTGRIQQVFGIIMILTAFAIYTNYDKTLQAKLLDAFPAYSTFLYSLEGNEEVQKQLTTLKDMKEDMQKPKEESSGLPVLYRAPEFTGITAWLNVDKPLTMQDLRGKVVLIDFWTYTCINCIRTLPHVTSWYDTYNNPSRCSGTLRSSANDDLPSELKDKCFIVVGVHTPEFEFEKKRENVENAIKQYNIHYPVAQDNDFATWNAYRNRYWPAKYLVDANGNVRYVHFGEGKYEETEEAIRSLLAEAGNQQSTSTPQMPDETPQTRLSPETYLGSKRMELYYPKGTLANGTQTFTIAETFPTDTFTLGGTWTTTDESLISGKGAFLAHSFRASNVFLVLRPSETGGKIKVYLNGSVVNEKLAGKDVKDGMVTVDSDRLYHLINLPSKDKNYILLLEFQTEGIEAFAFTFG